MPVEAHSEKEKDSNVEDSQEKENVPDYLQEKMSERALNTKLRCERCSSLVASPGSATYAKTEVSLALRCLTPNPDLTLVDGRIAGHLGAADGLKTLSIHMCVCPHFGM